jgi:GT2 family glycosyltransferase/glycosyltransferase involved in cell wall biosynthesis
MATAASSPALSILVVHSELPMPDRHSGSLRLRRLLEAMVDDGHTVTFLAQAGLGQEAYAAELSELGIDVVPVDSRRLAEMGIPCPGPALDFPALMRRGRFDVAWLSFYDVAERYLPEIRSCSPATRIVIDTVDVHCVRERRGAELSGDAAQLRAAERTREREQRIYSQADALIAVTDDDARALAELAPAVPVAVIGNVHAEAPPGPGFERRSGLVFVGNFDHAPNVDAMVHFGAAAWPAIAERLPGATLSIVGQLPPPAVQALAGPSVTVTGWVPEVMPYLESARVSIAPLRYGAGVKGKIGEALSHGLPVVTTPIGAEGMGLIHGEHVLIGEGDAFVDAVCRLHEDRELWDRLAAAGRAYVGRRQSPEVARSAVRALFELAVPRCFVAAEPWVDRERLRETLAAYIAEFQDSGAAATLVLPAPADELTLEQAGEQVAAMVHELRADPETIPDVVVAATVASPAVPRNAVMVGGGGRTGGPERPAPAAARAARHAVEASIIICAYGKREYSERCLESLERALGDRLSRSWEVVLVDNASPDSTAELFSEWSHRAKVVSLDRNRNFAGGNNAGAEVAAGEVLIFLNNDTEVPPAALEALVEEALRPGVGAVGTRLLYPDGRIQHGGFAWRPSPTGLQPFHLFHFENGDVAAARTNFDVGAVTGACLALPADTFRAVGGFDEGYVNGWEDVDLCLRVRSAGGRVRLRGDVHVVHHEGVTSGGHYNRDRNVRLFAARWARTVIDDRHVVERTLGAAFSPLADVPVGGVAPDGAPLTVAGPLGSLGSSGDEARSLLACLAANGVDVAARLDAPSWVGPSLGEADWRRLVDAHARAARPDALGIRIGTPSAGAPSAGAGAPRVLRVADACPRRPEGAIAWVASPALRDELLAGGWPAEAITVLPAAGIDAFRGPGGSGVLAILPADRRAACLLLDALAATRLEPIRLLPAIRSLELERLVAERLPGATVLPPATDERRLRQLAADSDIVIALNPDDRFDRQALVAASTGAAVVVRPGGPADAVLGALADRAELGDPGAVARAIAAAGEAAGEGRDARVAAVAGACGWPPLAFALAGVCVTAGATVS